MLIDYVDNKSTTNAERTRRRSNQSHRHVCWNKCKTYTFLQIITYTGRGWTRANRVLSEYRRFFVARSSRSPRLSEASLCSSLTSFWFLRDFHWLYIFARTRSPGVEPKRHTVLCCEQSTEFRSHQLTFGEVVVRLYGLPNPHSVGSLVRASYAHTRTHTLASLT